MKIITTSDWHLGNLFHGNDRLPEHRHFFDWLLEQLECHRPDALLVAGDVFDNGNPSAASQNAYYRFLASATQCCPDMQVVVTAGNHDSASRLEAPRPLLARYKVEIRGSVRRSWRPTDDGGCWVNDYDDLVIPVVNADGEEVVVLAVPYLRSDVALNGDYSRGVNRFLRELTQRARELYPGRTLVMMAHMYAKGADIATHDASEKIVIGGQEEVNMEGWGDHPDYLTCGHIHKRQHIWNTDWARYTGSVLPMSFAEVDYKHGVDLLTVADDGCVAVDFLEYVPQHRLRILPGGDEGLSPAKLKRLIDKELAPRGDDGLLGSLYDYVMLKVAMDKADNDAVRELEAFVATKDAVLCKIQKILPELNMHTIAGDRVITTIDDVLDRNPLETLREAFFIQHNMEMNDNQVALLQELLKGIKNETND